MLLCVQSNDKSDTLTAVVGCRNKFHRVNGRFSGKNFSATAKFGRPNLSHKSKLSLNSKLLLVKEGKCETKITGLHCGPYDTPLEKGEIRYIQCVPKMPPLKSLHCC